MSEEMIKEKILLQKHEHALSKERLFWRYFFYGTVLVFSGLALGKVGEVILLGAVIFMALMTGAALGVPGIYGGLRGRINRIEEELLNLEE